MEYKLISLQDFLKECQTPVPTQENLKSFHSQISDLLKVDDKETEEHQKNALSIFLRESFDYQCNTKGYIDLAIYQEGQVRVIFECKSLSNKSEFVTDENDLDSKAFHESILYYLREFLTHKNNNLTFIILTNTRDFYLIDAKEYLVFAKNKEIKKAFENCEKKQGNDTSTKRFYDELENILPKLKHSMSYTHFTLSATLSDCPPHIYQVLSPQVLLKTISYIDANTLNQAFYDELLYILGLREVAQNSKVFIEASQTPNTLLDALCKAYGFNPVSDFESIFALLTTWNNRILFLRLLESMLLSFKHIDTPFLQIERIGDFPTLNTLFFEVLAKKEKERSNIPHFLESIPYLNSSLFDRNALELDGKEIKLLDSRPLELYPHSILHKDEAFKRDYKDGKSLPLLEYLFAFLRAYDFTTIPSDIKDNIKINQNKLINSAVLGLVFEKLNGYQEGSFYTPSFITNYMCKQSLEKVVIDKFNQAKSWDCKDLESLKSKIDKLTDASNGYREANEIFDSITICDPSVGSGHFLVSALNELIYLKYSLNILCDENNQRLKDIILELQNDEILIRDSQNKIFNYSLPKHENIESHKLQKALFQIKRKLIESCLFGADINPNSCEITKLRLWIELLKYSYYKDIENKYLETLPNIDINIKCGNSLISRFDTKDSLKRIPNIKHQIDMYKKLVNDYKHADQDILISKHDLDSQIKRIKESFTLTLKDPKTRSQLKEAIKNHITLYGTYLLDDESLLDGLDEMQHNLFGTPSLSEEEEESALDSYSHIQKLRKKLDLVLKGEEYRDAFEWRFEFPEVLDSEGNFLGFDLIIGNPPYMQVPKGKYSAKFYPYSEGKDKGKQNLYKVFVELGFNLGHTNSIIALITQSSIMCDLSSQFTRELLLTQTQMQYFVEFKKNQKLFTEVIQGVCILEFVKAKPESTHKFKIAIDNAESRMDEIDFELIGQEEILEFFPLYEIPLIKKGEMSIVSKVKRNKILLKEMIESGLQGNINTIHLGRVQSDIETGLFLMKGKNIHRYYLDNDFMHCVKTDETFKMCETNAQFHIIALQGITGTTDKNRIHCTLLESKNTNIFVFLHSTKMLFMSNVKEAKFLVGLLNSKLLDWLFRITSTNNNINLYELESLPIPKIDSKNKKLTDELIALVDEILQSKAKDPNTDTSSLESQIDVLVYKLYGLSEEEISVIEGR